MENDLKDFYDNQFKIDMPELPEFEQLTEKQKSILSSSFSYNNFLLWKSQKKFAESLAKEIEKISNGVNKLFLRQ